MHRKAKPAAERWTRELEHVVLKLPSAGNSKMLAISPNFLEPKKQSLLSFQVLAVPSSSIAFGGTKSCT